MVGLTPVAALVVVFVWLGLSARAFDRQVQWRLLALITAIVILTFVFGQVDAPASTGMAP